MRKTAWQDVFLLCGKPEISLASKSNAWDRCVASLGGGMRQELMGFAGSPLFFVTATEQSLPDAPMDRHGRLPGKAKPYPGS